jgi:hypothetical protein
VLAELLDQLVHVVADEADVGVLGRDDGEVCALAGLDDEQWNSVIDWRRPPLPSPNSAEAP